MRSPPSAGIVYLAVTIAAVGLGVGWLLRPFWFEQAGDAAHREGLAYAARLCARAGGEERDRRIRALLEGARVESLRSGDGAPLCAALEELLARDLLVPSLHCTSWHGGAVWLLGATADGRGVAGESLTVLLRNDSTAPLRPSLRWRWVPAQTSAAAVDEGSGDVTWVGADGGSGALAFVEDCAELPVAVLPPGASTLVAIRCAHPERLQLADSGPPAR